MADEIDPAQDRQMNYLLVLQAVDTVEGAVFGHDDGNDLHVRIDFDRWIMMDRPTKLWVDILAVDS